MQAAQATLRQSLQNHIAQTMAQDASRTGYAEAKRMCIDEVRRVDDASRTGYAEAKVQRFRVVPSPPMQAAQATLRQRRSRPTSRKK